MAVKISLKINVTSDFHLGTGTGRGRATDAVVLTDADGVPYISGSTIKGLSRWHACRLIDCFPGLGPKPIVPETDGLSANDEKGRFFDPDELRGPAFEIFGGGSEHGYAEQRMWFDHALALPKNSVRHLTRSGRSARDRISGRARESYLFFYEDAGPAVFATELTCDDDLSPEALLLLVISLRRIDALGGQRRRGKGNCECSVKIIDPGHGADLVNLKGLTLPSQNTDEASRFQEFAKPILEKSKTQWCRSSGAEYEPKTSDDRLPQYMSEESVGVYDGSKTKPTVWLVFAVARSPLTLGHEQAVDNTVASEDFISGTSFRGALAWQSIRDGLDTNSSLFHNVFVRERIQFGPLYPASSTWSSNNPLAMTFPIPASFCTCKHFPGSKSVTPRSPHGLADRMWHSGDECNYCQAATKQADGYLQLAGTPSDASLCLVRPTMRVFQRTAIDEETQRGADRKLFGLESVPQNTKFAGYIWGEEMLLMQTLGNRLDKWTRVRVGKSKSRGQGLVEIFLRKAPRLDEVYPYSQSRPNSLNHLESEQSGAGKECENEFFVTLYSDLIAVDEYLRPITKMTARLLWWLLNQQGDPPFKMEQGFVGTRRIGGYLGVVGLPRTADVAITAGSTWRFCWKRPIDNASRTQVRSALMKAQQSGLGLRRGEGYGRIVLDHPVHLAKWDNMTLPPQPMNNVEFAKFPDENIGSPLPLPNRSRQLAVELTLGSAGKGDRAYQRLFAELSQAEDPAEEIQILFDDPLYRKGKAKNLVNELNKVVSDQLPLFENKHGQTICVARKLNSDPQKVEQLREALRKYSEEVVDHV